jgi:ATP-dependent RNA helicase DDX20
MAAMESVRGFKVRVIVSTDVMARGVDFDRVNLVVNVDLPPDAATYVHRVGRTGRFGSRGIAVALVSHLELRKLQGYLTSVKGGEPACFLWL